MKKYLGVIIGGLVCGAVVGGAVTILAAIFFGVVLSGEEDGDVSKSVVIDEPAGTKIASQPEEVTECHSYHDCNDGFACHRGQCEKAVMMIQTQCYPGAIPLDLDCDAVVDQVDNCPFVANTIVPGIGQPDRDHDGVGDACDLCVEPGSPSFSGATPGTAEWNGCPPSTVDAFVTIQVNSSDDQPAEIQVFHAVDASDPSRTDVSYGPALFEMKLTKEQACSREVEINARRMAGSFPWYSELGILDRLEVSVNGREVEPPTVRHAWTDPVGNLQLTPQMLGCSS